MQAESYHNYLYWYDFTVFECIIMLGLWAQEISVVDLLAVFLRWDHLSILNIQRLRKGL